MSKSLTKNLKELSGNTLSETLCLLKEIDTLVSVKYSHVNDESLVQQVYGATLAEIEEIENEFTRRANS